MDRETVYAERPPAEADGRVLRGADRFGAVALRGRTWDYSVKPTPAMICHSWFFTLSSGASGSSFRLVRPS